MRSTLVASVLMVSVGGVATSQTETRPPGAARSSASSAGQAAEVSVVGCLNDASGKLRLMGEDGKVYDLIGHAAELRRQIGDKLEVSGSEDVPLTPPQGHTWPESNLRVTSVKTIFHKNPAGVRPYLGDVAHWRSYKNKTYGLALHYPETLERLDEPAFLGGSDFVDEDGVVTLQGFAVTGEMYPNANFGGGSFTVFVNPTIRSKGTCRQFGWLMRPIPALTARGIQYPGVSRTGVAAGHASDQYHFHTYQNGLCYEFAFDFGWNTGTGMEPMFLCSVQPVLEQNHRELMKALLSQVQFVTPGIRRAAREKPHRSSPPTVLSLERSTADTAFRSTTVTVSWSTRGVDYVQLRYPCVEKLSVSELGGADSPWPPGVDMKCGAVVGQNFPPNGSAKLMLSNFNPSSVKFVLSIEPFSDGVGYPEQSKTITISVGPHP